MLSILKIFTPFIVNHYFHLIYELIEVTTHDITTTLL